MNRKLSRSVGALSVLAAISSTHIARAAPPNLNGTDALNDVIVSLIGDCGVDASNLTYVGGGSGVAGAAMVNELAPQPSIGGPFEQIAAPLSRPPSTLQPTNANYHTAADNTECGLAFAKQPGAIDTAEGLAIGLDGIVMVTNSESSEFCGGGHAHRDNVSPASAPFSAMPVSLGWKTVLRVLYTGYDPETNTPGKCNPADNPTRAALADDFSRLFEAGCSQPSGCTGIVHAFRRRDRSAAVETFLALLGASSINLSTGAPFCNGTDGEDKDPVRRSCAPHEQVCEADGTLGLVLPIVTPTLTDVPVELYGPPLPGFAGTAGSAPFAKLKPAVGTSCPNPPPPTTDPSMLKISPCGGNVVYNLPAGCVFPNSLRCDCRFPLPSDFAAATVQATGAACLVNGQPLLPNIEFNWNRRAGGCPAVVDGGSPTLWNYLNGDNGTLDNSPATWGTRTVKTISGLPSWRPALPTGQRCCNVKCPNNGPTVFVREDVRVMNLAWRNKANGRVRDFDVASSVQFRPAFYRIHTNALGLSSIGNTNPTTPVCQRPRDSNQLGCLLENPKNCSVGFAGSEAFAWLNTEPLALGNQATAVDPSVASIQDLALDPANAYPFARKLYYTSLRGFSDPLFSNGTAFEKAQGILAKCMLDGNNPALGKAIDASGYVRMPGPIATEPMCP